MTLKTVEIVSGAIGIMLDPPGSYVHSEKLPKQESSSEATFQFMPSDSDTHLIARDLSARARPKIVPNYSECGQSQTAGNRRLPSLRRNSTWYTSGSLSVPGARNRHV
jgi:hypothetical protein